MELERLLGGGTPDVAGEGGDQAGKAMQKQASVRKGPKAAGASKAVSIQGGWRGKPLKLGGQGVASHNE